jgi:type VI secretion system protein
MAKQVRSYATVCSPLNPAVFARPVHSRRRGFTTLLLVCASAVLTSGCFWRRPPVRTNEFTLRTAPTVNDNRPIAVAAVMVYDRNVLTTVSKMTAAQWFATREQLLNDSPNGLEERDWELVPGSQVRLAPLPFPHKGLGLFVFANYAGPGEHRARLDDWKQPSVTLGDRTLSVGGRK